MTRWSKAGTTEPRLAQRARVILASAQGLDLRSKKELVDQILYSIKKYTAERTQPFKWTYPGKPLAA